MLMMTKDADKKMKKKSGVGTEAPTPSLSTV